MHPDTKALLLKYDEADAWEYPSNFDGEHIEQRARAVFAELDNCFDGLVFEDWLYNQDASFGLAVVFPLPESDRFIQAPSLRFSNFGNLAALAFEEGLPEQAKPLIVASLARHGFVFIESDALDEAYDGVMSPDPVLTTWWARYFDWI